MTFPRVLIISSSVFNKVTGGGILLSNLFARWPHECLAELHCDAASPDTSVCRRYYALSHREMSWAFPFSLFQRLRMPMPTQVMRPAGDRTTLLRRFSKTVLGESLPWKVKLSEQLAKWIADFRPDVLYVQPGMPYMDLALDIATRYRLPIAVHLMDDWLSAYGKKGLLGPLVKRQAERQLERLIFTATVRLAIYEPLSAEYERRYNVPFLVSYNGVDVVTRLPHARSSWEPGKPFTLVYIGTIVPYAQRQSLVELCAVVSKMAERGESIRLCVYSADADQIAAFQSRPGIHIAAPPAEQDLFPTLSAADVLLLPVNFDDMSRYFVRYSFPAKLPLYMLSAVPILFYGPPDVVYVNEARDGAWGYVISEKGNASRLENSIRELWGNSGLREQLGRTAQKIAIERHDLSRIRQHFESIMSKIPLPK